MLFFSYLLWNSLVACWKAYILHLCLGVSRGLQMVAVVRTLIMAAKWRQHLGLFHILCTCYCGLQETKLHYRNVLSSRGTVYRTCLIPRRGETTGKQNNDKQEVKRKLIFVATKLCLWQNGNFSGAMLQFTAGCEGSGAFLKSDNKAQRPYRSRAQLRRPSI